MVQDFRNRASRGTLQSASFITKRHPAKGHGKFQNPHNNSSLTFHFTSSLRFSTEVDKQDQPETKTKDFPDDSAAHTDKGRLLHTLSKLQSRPKEESFIDMAQTHAAHLTPAHQSPWEKHNTNPPGLPFSFASSVSPHRKTTQKNTFMTLVLYTS